MSPNVLNPEAKIAGRAKLFAARHPRVSAVLLNLAALLAVAVWLGIALFAGMFFQFEAKTEIKPQEISSNGGFVLLSEKRLSGTALGAYLDHRSDLDYFYSAASGNARRPYRLPEFDVPQMEARKFVTSNFGAWTHSALNTARRLIPADKREFYLTPLPEEVPAEAEILVNGKVFDYPAALPLPVRSAVLRVSPRGKLPLRGINLVKSSGNSKYDRQLIELMERHLDELPPELCVVVCRPKTRQ